MSKVIIALTLFEQGLPGRQGGSFKLFPKQRVAVEAEDASTETLGIRIDGVAKILDKEVVEKLVGLGMIEVRDADELAAEDAASVKALQDALAAEVEARAKAQADAEAADAAAEAERAE